MKKEHFYENSPKSEWGTIAPESIVSPKERREIDKKRKRQAKLKALRGKK